MQVVIDLRVQIRRGILLDIDSFWGLHAHNVSVPTNLCELAKLKDTERSSNGQKQTPTVMSFRVYLWKITLAADRRGLPANDVYFFNGVKFFPHKTEEIMAC